MLAAPLFTISLWTVAKAIAVLVCASVAFLVLQMIHLYAVLAWNDVRTRGINYYGLSAADRQRFKTLLYYHRLILSPVIGLLSLGARFNIAKIGFTYRGVAGPLGTCSPESFQKAAERHPRAGDVFVATQMKCGTTWMQHVVYQVLTRGVGDLVESWTALYSISPWIESLRSISIEDAPLVGTERPSRIIKTHMPVQLCPHGTEAKYIYVARHPVSCFASCADFLATNAGSFCRGLGDDRKVVPIGNVHVVGHMACARAGLVETVAGALQRAVRFLRGNEDRPAHDDPAGGRSPGDPRS